MQQSQSNPLRRLWWQIRRWTVGVKYTGHPVEREEEA
jgi:hypothetical protein